MRACESAIYRGLSEVLPFYLVAVSFSMDFIAREYAWSHLSFSSSSTSFAQYSFSRFWSGSLIFSFLHSVLQSKSPFVHYFYSSFWWFSFFSLYIHPLLFVIVVWLWQKSWLLFCYLSRCFACLLWNGRVVSLFCTVRLLSCACFYQELSSLIRYRRPPFRRFRIKITCNYFLFSPLSGYLL